jgi:hypothetical protein
VAAAVAGASAIEIGRQLKYDVHDSQIDSKGNDFVRLLQAIWDLIAAGPTLSTSSCGIVVSLGCYKR